MGFLRIGWQNYFNIMIFLLKYTYILICMWRNVRYNFFDFCLGSTAMCTGADLASPTCHGTGCFFASSRGYAIKICLESFPISLEASWHWLILASIGAIEHYTSSQYKLSIILIHTLPSNYLILSQ